MTTLNRREKRRPVYRLIRTYNKKAQRWRVPWSHLSASERKIRYQKALRHINYVNAPHPGSFTEYARIQAGLDKHQEPPITIKRGRRLPALFGSSARTEVLAILSETGPITVRELSRIRGKDSGAVFGVIEKLRSAGLVVKRCRPGGRRYVSLNRAHRAIRALRRLLKAMVRESGLRVPKYSGGRYGLPLDRDPSPPIVEDRLFGSEIRSHLILMLAAMRESNVQTLTRATGFNYQSISYSVLALERLGILTTRRVGKDRLVRLSKTYSWSRLYQNFLRELLVSLPRQTTIAHAIRRATRSD